MNFKSYYKLSSILLILTGFLAILITGSYPISVLGGIFVTLLYATFDDNLIRWLPIPKNVWNGVALVLLGYLVYDSFWISQDLIGNGVRFVVYLQIVKLLSPKTNRDIWQIYLLSFLHLLASTVISSDISFSIPFIIYIVFATWTLTMFTLKVQLENTGQPEKREAVLRQLFRSKDVITRGFLTMTSVLSLTIIAFTLLIFFTFPRVSMRNFLKRIDSRQKVSGFSDNVELGTIGNIKTSDKIVMRIEIDPKILETLNVDQLYWRGTASDQFDGRSWKQTLDARQAINLDLDSGVLSLTKNIAKEGKTFSYRVFVEALDPPMLFGADQLFRITWDKPMIEKIFRRSLALNQDEYGGLHFTGLTTYASDLTYNAESVLNSHQAEKLKQEKGEYTRYEKDIYLQIPKLKVDVEKLIREIPILPEASIYQKAKAIVGYIESKYSYTLNVQDIGVEDPLHFFFIDKKEGHCEYFSTALAIALRVHGIPAREVVGFRGGEINPFGGYLAVRQKDAHTWVEALMPETGWIRLDASPPDSRFHLTTPRFLALSQFVDNLRLRWNKYIIEYDLRSQAKLVEGLVKRLVEFGSKKVTKEDDEPGQKKNPFPISPKIWIFIFLGTGLFVLVNLVQTFRARKNPSFGFYEKVLSLLTRYHFEKRKSETVKEFRKRVEIKLGAFKHWPPLEEMYYQERFGGRPAPSTQWQKEFKAFEMELRIRARNQKHSEQKKAA